jgi:hypothetical protein
VANTIAIWGIFFAVAGILSFIVYLAWKQRND